MTTITLCPMCGEGYLQPHVQNGVAYINGNTVKFSSTYAVCTHCESEVMDFDDMEHNTNECEIIKVFMNKEIKRLYTNAISSGSTHSD